MIDFQNASFVKLNHADPAKAAEALDGLLVPGETVQAAFRSVRDWVIFTDRRIVTVNIQGMTGKKRDFTSLPYKRIQVFSVETAGHFDLESELEMWFSGLGKVMLEFANGVDIRALAQLIGSRAL
ncbi:PH domain-containing protein [Bifidobacterium cuniculi]|uniref:Cytoplasmic protein n=1 Tax=Bifidobacterium cuniculi TaxID=1688 RepID=A0A087AY67_9BIFI|nr:PH domain-containing protein [Bifidobacterium cuniculi]KFI63717.1 cytoplasmic protein [Bifidobacterium cuniculi]